MNIHGYFSVFNTQNEFTMMEANVGSLPLFLSRSLFLSLSHGQNPTNLQNIHILTINIGTMRINVCLDTTYGNDGFRLVFVGYDYKVYNSVMFEAPCMVILLFSL